MKKTRRSVLRAKKRAAQVTSNLFEATLMSPTEVEKFSCHCSKEVRKKMRGHWLLNGTVSKSMFEILVNNSSSYVVSEMISFLTPSGAAYVVVVCQFRDWQHRFVLPLYDSKVMEYFSPSTDKPLMFQLSCAGGEEDGILYDCPMPRFELWSIWEFGNEVDLQNTGQFVLELPSLICEMLSPIGKITSSNQVIRHVDVSVLMPASYDEYCDHEDAIEVAA